MEEGSQKIRSLKDWPARERPRERLLNLGVAALSDAELLSVFLRSGLPGRNAHEISLEILKDFESLAGLAKCSPKELLKIPGLGPAKVSSLVAAFEMGRRLTEAKVKDRPVISSSRDVVDLLCQHAQAESGESFKAILLDAKNRFLKLMTLTQGEPAQVAISVPQVLRTLVREGNAAVIFTHHHPSGDPRPSPEDRKVTRELHRGCESIGVAMHDHLIIAGKDFFSFAEEGLM